MSYRRCLYHYLFLESEFKVWAFDLVVKTWVKMRTSGFDNHFQLLTPILPMQTLEGSGEGSGGWVPGTHVGTLD